MSHVTWAITVPPTVEPVSLEEARQHLNDPPEAHNATISALVAAARQHIERVCERALMPQKWRISRDEFPDGCIQIPGGLVRVIDSVTYVDANGATQTLASSAYQADLDSQPARLYPLASAGAWPATKSGTLNALQVVAQVGYAKAADVPAPIKAALLLMVADLFEHREGQVVGMTVTDNPAVTRLLRPYKRIVP